MSEWEDWAPQKVIVPASMTDQTIHHGVHRNSTHTSVICCVSAAGESLTPFVAFSQVNDKVIETLKIKKISDGCRHGTRTQAKGVCQCNTFSAVCDKYPDPVH
jgi:hypothetical protein